MILEKSAIAIKDLMRVFRVKEKAEAGLAASIRSFIRPKMKDVAAVNGISLDVRRGEIRGLIGPNGAGKSTTIKILCGVLHPTSGEVDSLGFVPWRDRKTYVRRIGALFGQKSQLIWELPALDSFELNRVIYKIPPADYKRRLSEFMELLRIEDIVKKPVRQISLGERMKCELVSAMLHDPELIFLDEPTIGIDIISKEAIRAFIRKVNVERRTTFIVTTHDLADIENLCAYVTIINNGAKVFDDSIRKLTQFFSDRKVLTLDFTEPVEEKRLAAYGIIEYKPLYCKIELDTTKLPIRECVSGLFAELPIRDINIMPIPIEEVIKTVYRSGSGGN